MKHRFTVHTHTDAVDGKSSARRMIESAVRRGMTAVGFAEQEEYAGQLGNFKQKRGGEADDGGALCIQME